MSHTPDTKYRLSKSKIAAFEHCPKRLWLQIHHRELGKFDAATLARFRFGHEVGERARFVVPDGILVDPLPDIPAALARTAELLTLVPPRPIFEATFQHEDVLVCVDILDPDGEGGWRAIEVKATSRVGSHHLADLATQVWTMLGCGVKVSSAAIRHIDGRINWARPDIAAVKFQTTDVSRYLGPLIDQLPALADAARTMVRGEQPHRVVGRHCERPFACEFRDHCRGSVREWQ
jgi:hypothetical protein